MLEWGVLAIVVLIIAGALGYYGRRVQAEAERATVISSLGALRTAFVLDHLQHTVRDAGGNSPPTQVNPFLLLSQPLLNYRGEQSVVKSLSTVPGSWLYDPQCQCVGYAPLDPDWSDLPSGSTLMWFKVSEGPGARQLTAVQTYQWRGMEIR